jgi:hypothetical protein
LDQQAEVSLQGQVHENAYQGQGLQATDEGIPDLGSSQEGAQEAKLRMESAFVQEEEEKVPQNVASCQGGHVQQIRPESRSLQGVLQVPQDEVAAL